LLWKSPEWWAAQKLRFVQKIQSGTCALVNKVQNAETKEFFALKTFPAFISFEKYEILCPEDVLPLDFFNNLKRRSMKRLEEENLDPAVFDLAHPLGLKEIMNIEMLDGLFQRQEETGLWTRPLAWRINAMTIDILYDYMPLCLTHFPVLIVKDGKVRKGVWDHAHGKRDWKAKVTHDQIVLWWTSIHKLFTSLLGLLKQWHPSGITHNDLFTTNVLYETGPGGDLDIASVKVCDLGALRARHHFTMDSPYAHEQPKTWYERESDISSVAGLMLDVLGCGFFVKHLKDVRLSGANALHNRDFSVFDSWSVVLTEQEQATWISPLRRLYSLIKKPNMAVEPGLGIEKISALCPFLGPSFEPQEASALPPLYGPLRFELLAETRFLWGVSPEKPRKIARITAPLCYRINEGGGKYFSWDMWFVLCETACALAVRTNSVQKAVDLAQHLWAKIKSPQEYSFMKYKPLPESTTAEELHAGFEIVLRHWKSQKRGVEVLSAWLMQVLPFPTSRWPDYYWCEECQSVDGHAREPGTCLWGCFSLVLKIVWSIMEYDQLICYLQYDTEKRCAQCWNWAVEIMHRNKEQFLTWTFWKSFCTQVKEKPLERDLARMNRIDYSMFPELVTQTLAFALVKTFFANQ
jgi:hypothetical protein